MCTKTGLSRFRSNRSLREIAATGWYECGIDEQSISEVTEHRLDAVREYKRTSETMRRDSCEIIRGDVHKNQEVSKELHININVNVNVNKNWMLCLFIFVS